MRYARNGKAKCLSFLCASFPQIRYTDEISRWRMEKRLRWISKMPRKSPSARGQARNSHSCQSTSLHSARSLSFLPLRSATKATSKFCVGPLCATDKLAQCQMEWIPFASKMNASSAPTACNISLSVGNGNHVITKPT